ncbi:hypothetical protein [Agromyces mariniharenae]|uniref:hypothetical protein n=1 Tax=Agromyces mariniharenae TaxID=2604423 RepID=UPI001EE5E0D5|nr:hypothetical protein [Agromyces mariniharenae]
MRDAGQQVRGERRAARIHAASREHRARIGRRLAPLAAAFAVLSLGLTFALTPQAPAPAQMPGASEAFSGDTQTVSVAADVAAPDVSHESYVSTTGPETLVESGTNHDWAKLVLISGDFPLTQANIDVMLRWMRQENGPDNWWNRNNPLNNGNGSGGGSGLGSYATLSIAAEYAADSLRRYAFYDAIEASLEAGTDANATAQAIWASPWATSHYGYGSHWSTAPVKVITAPESAWG